VAKTPNAPSKTIKNIGEKSHPNLLIISDVRMLDAPCCKAVGPQQIHHRLHRFPRIPRRREVPTDFGDGKWFKNGK
jgi:hypothetical protein